MKLLMDSFWRAALYCLHPKVIGLSLLPLALMTALTFGLAYFFWEPAIDGIRAQFEAWSLLQALHDWLEKIGWGSLWTSLAPTVLVLLAVPVVVVVSLLLVSVFMTPAMGRLVAARRFPALERKRGGSFTGGFFTALGSTALALVVLILSIPLWLIPPLVLIIPPLVWGWLNYRVMSYDVLADHASREERRALIARYRLVLLGMGILTGYLGAAPSLVFASGVAFVIMAPVLVPVAIWVYTLVFAFSALWFSHFLMAALASWRCEQGDGVDVVPATVGAGTAVDPVQPAPLLPAAAPTDMSSSASIPLPPP